jgi:hypothetical protein
MQDQLPKLPFIVHSCLGNQDSRTKLFNNLRAKGEFDESTFDYSSF